MLRPNQYRAQVVWSAAEQSGESDGDGEEAGEAKRLVLAQGFEVAPQALRSGVDAADELGSRALVTVVRFGLGY